MKQEALICLDIGGTNLRMGLVDRQLRLSRVTILPTAAAAGESFPEKLTASIRAYRQEAEEAYTVKGVSLGVPAAVDKHRQVVLQAPNVPGLDGVPIVALLQEALRLPVFLSKDVDLLLTYDLNQLGLPTEGLTVGIYFGTGIGNSICLNGQILTGKNGVAGELGHIPQLYSTIPCGCGNETCIEPIGGGRRLQELCATRFPGTHISQLYALHGHAPEVRRQVDAMAVTVATEVNILDPDYVIIGGGLPLMEGFPREYFLERVLAHTRKPRPAENLDIRFSRPNQENGILGAGIYGWKLLSNVK